MVRITFVVAALLLVGLTSSTVAAQEPGKQSDKARKAIVLLGALGVNSNDAKAFIADIDSRVENNTLNITKERIGEGTLKFHYRLGDGVNIDNFELQYTPDNSNWKGVARKDSVMVHYNYTF